MANEKQFVEGLFIDTKETQYGEIVKLSIIADRFVDFISSNKNEKGYVNIDILSTRDGKKYAKLNDFKPSSGGSSSAKQDDDLPF